MIHGMEGDLIHSEFRKSGIIERGFISVEGEHFRYLSERERESQPPFGKEFNDNELLAKSGSIYRLQKGDARKMGFFTIPEFFRSNEGSGAEYVENIYILVKVGRHV